MTHKEYRKYLRQLKYSGWFLLGEFIIAIIIVLSFIFHFKR